MVRVSHRKLIFAAGIRDNCVQNFLNEINQLNRCDERSRCEGDSRSDKLFSSPTSVKLNKQMN